MFCKSKNGTNITGTTYHSTNNISISTNQQQLQSPSKLIAPETTLIGLTKQTNLIVTFMCNQRAHPNKTMIKGGYIEPN